MVKDVTPRPLNDEQQTMQSLKQYGGYIISAIVLALAGYFGWAYYQNHGGRVDMAATNDFAKIQASQQALVALSEQNTEANKQQLGEKTNALQKDIASFVAAYPNSAYTWQALMLQAKLQTDTNQTAEAVATLKRATELKLNDTGLQALATLRYAEALLANKQLDEANAALNIPFPAVFDASKNELLGDISMAKNDKTAASEFYQKAWNAVEERNKAQSLHEDRALLRFKMEDLGLSPKLPNEPESVVAKPVADANTPNAKAELTLQSATAGTTNVDNAKAPTNASSKTDVKKQSTNSTTTKSKEMKSVPNEKIEKSVEKSK